MSYLSMEDLQRIGYGALSLTSNVVRLGHTRPSHSLSYIQDEITDGKPLIQNYALDLIAWQAGYPGRPGAEERCRGLVVDSGFMRAQLEVLTREMSA
jgi:hypothetical protein